MITKTCSKCKIKKEISEFGTDNYQRDGITCSCLQCKRETSKKSSLKRKDKEKEYHKNYRESNRELLKNKNKEYNLRTREARIARSKKYYKNNKDKAFVRYTLKRIFNNWRGKREESEKLLGYNIEALKNHLSKFGCLEDKNLEIEHIVPVSFLLKKIEDKEECARISNDLRNLMLLDKSLNHKKHNKITFEHVPEFHMTDLKEFLQELNNKGISW